MSLIIDAQPAPLQTDSDGVVRVGGTRVTLETIVISFQQGATAEEIAQQYPTVELSDVYAVIAYYLRHHDAVETYLAGVTQESDSIRRSLESNIDRRELRDRLLARRSSKE